MAKQKKVVVKKATVKSNTKTDTNMVTENANTTLFDELYESNGDLKNQTKSIVQRGLQRRIQGAYDSGLAELDQVNFNILTERSKLSRMDINFINSQYARIEAIEKTLSYVEKEYNTLFGEEISK